MNPSITTTSTPSSLTLQKADRVGVAASVLCAIHCALTPVLLIALPTFGQIWAHPASHILVAIFVVPLAIFSIRKGYQSHKKRWILSTASIGILLILVGAALPAFGKSNDSAKVPTTETNAVTPPVSDQVNSCESCESTCSEGECSTNATANTNQSETASQTTCVDNCCPSLQTDESGNTTLHIPPAAIVTTLGGIFLITAHLGNLCSCGHACRTTECSSCA